MVMLKKRHSVVAAPPEFKVDGQERIVKAEVFSHRIRSDGCNYFVAYELRAERKNGAVVFASKTYEELKAVWQSLSKPYKFPKTWKYKDLLRPKLLLNGASALEEAEIEQRIEKTKLRLNEFLVEVVDDAMTCLNTNYALLNFFGNLPFRLDWPGPKDTLDLKVVDVPHYNSNIEWWYYNGNCEVEGRGEMSVFVCWFKGAVGYDYEKHKRKFNYSVMAALVDVEKKEYSSTCVIDPGAHKTLKRLLNSDGEVARLDPRLRAALNEVFDKEKLPLPDHQATSVECKMDSLAITIDDNTFHKSGDTYKMRVRLRKTSHETCDKVLNLSFKPRKLPIKQGVDGLQRAFDDAQHMYYYSIPRMEMTGTIDFGDQGDESSGAIGGGGGAGPQIIKNGSGWYDHEFGGTELEQTTEELYKEKIALEVNPSAPLVRRRETVVEHTHRFGWSWSSVQLNNNKEVIFTHVIDPSEDRLIERSIQIIDEHGASFTLNAEEGSLTPMELETEGNNNHVHVSIEYEEKELWTSVRSYQLFPCKYVFRAPSHNIDMTIEMEFPDQEFITIIRYPSFYEGRVKAYGTLLGESVHGIGFMERAGMMKTFHLGDFFNKLGDKVRESVCDVLDLNPDYDKATRMVADEGRTNFMTSVDIPRYVDTVVQPIRDVVDRGGKSWRSFAILACIDMVGGDSREYSHFMSLPEIMHCGSLIIDDVQDESDVRRGAPCVHHLYGNALAINAGCAAWFLCETVFADGCKKGNLSEEEKKERNLKLYNLYFTALRAGHAGQALDIAGQDHLIEEVVETGDAERLEAAIIAVHRLKTAVPAAIVSEMGAMMGQANKEQLDAIQNYFLKVGIAFQIIDDVLNLRGMKKIDPKTGKQSQALKILGEDIMAGKVTYPIAVAMRKMAGKEERRKLWKVIESKPQKSSIVDSCIATLEGVNAIDESQEIAEKMVEEAWDLLDKVTDESYSKVLLRAFSFYLLKRHY